MRTRVVVLAVLATVASCSSEPPRDGTAATAARAQADTIVGTVTWRPASPVTSPPGRIGFAIAYQGAGKVLLFGGETLTGRLNDTWLWDGVTWQAVTSTVAPPARSGHALAFDEKRARVILFGGSDADGKPLADTWAWDGSSWKELTPPLVPPARQGHAMAYHPGRGEITLFGGCADCSALDLQDTWSWDGLTWSAVAPAVSPDPRTDASMAFDGQGLVLYGGRGIPTGPDVLYADTWTFDGSSWALASTPRSPSKKSGAAAAYDAPRKRVVQYGGNSCFRACRACTPLCDAYDETWEWDGTGWKQRSPQPTDENNVGRSTLAYDSVRRTAVLVSGRVAEPSLRTWEYLSYADACVTDDDCETGACRASSAQPPNGDRLCCTGACGVCQDCVFTGSGCVAVRDRDDLDSCTGDSTCDPQGQCKKKLGQPCGGGGDCASAICTEGSCCNVDSCAPFACGASGACVAACSTAKDCAQGHDCHAGACVPSSPLCDGNVAVKPDGTRIDCAPYACGVGGCLTRCASSDECAPGFACGAAGTCVAPRSSAPSCAIAIGGGASRSSSSSGGGEESSAPSGIGWLGVLAALFARRRRAQAR